MAKAPKVRETEEERALKEVSVAQWNDYVSRFRPAEAELIKRAELTGGEKASVRGQAATDVASAFKGLTKGTITAGEVSGADVSSGKTKFGLAANADARGRSIGLGTVAGELGAMESQDRQQAGIAAMGRGIAADVTQSMAQGARRATRVAMAEAAGKFERNQAMLNAGAAVAGAAARKWGPELMNKRMLKKHGMDIKSNWDKNIESAKFRSAWPGGTGHTWGDIPKHAFFKGYSPFTRGLGDF
jgi:hypothetical protein